MAGQAAGLKQCLPHWFGIGNRDERDIMFGKRFA